MSSSLWINVNYIFNWATAVFTALNVLWMVEMIVNAIVQRNDLNYFVSKDWKQPLIITTVLAVISTGIIYVSALGIFAFAISLFALAFQFFFMLDYSKMLASQIEDAWYLKSTYVSLTIIGFSFVSLLVFLVTTIATAGIGF